MIQLRNTSLPTTARTNLRRLQRRVDGETNYEDRVSTAKVLFAQQNRTNNATFQAVRRALTRMCSGARRCAYCEDSSADEVEHIKPKDLYPEVTFVWENYLYACGPCNSPKNNHFAVFATATGNLIDVTRKPGQPITPPIMGESVFINPRRENPILFMELDLIDTFYFLPTAPVGSKDYIRAEYSIKVLRLNDRDILPAARKEAYHSYRARLFEYIIKRNNGMSQKQLTKLIKALRRMGHPTVWAEMKRQESLIPELHDLFTQAPEALTW